MKALHNLTKTMYKQQSFYRIENINKLRCKQNCICLHVNVHFMRARAQTCTYARTLLLTYNTQVIN